MEEEAVIYPRSISNVLVRVISTKEIGYADAVNGTETQSTMIRVAFRTGHVSEITLSNLREMSDGELISAVGLAEASSLRTKLGALLKKANATI